MTGSLKQVVVVRNDLDLSRGKLVAQACHASVLAYKSAGPSTGFESKIVVEAGLSRLKELAVRADAEGVPCRLVRDAGRTEVGRGTVTALAVGPAESDCVDSLTGDLSLLR